MLPIRSVWPSGAAFTTSVEPMMPPAPDLLSTTQDCPQACCSQAANRRATMSVVPAGAAGTTMRTLCAGFQAASARSAAGNRAVVGSVNAAVRAVRRVSVRIMDSLQIINVADNAYHARTGKNAPIAVSIFGAVTSRNSLVHFKPAARRIQVEE